MSQHPPLIKCLTDQDLRSLGIQFPLELRLIGRNEKQIDFFVLPVMNYIRNITIFGFLIRMHAAIIYVITQSPW